MCFSNQIICLFKKEIWLEEEIKNSELRVFSVKKIDVTANYLYSRVYKSYPIMIFMTLNGEIIRFEQPELKLCLFWPRK